jgi:LPXTG-motif cell wall-anchored protein
MRVTLIRTAFSLGLFALFVLPAPVLAAAAGPVADTSAVQAVATPTQPPAATQSQPPTPSSAPTGVTPAPTGRATPLESSPPVPGEGGSTGTTQQTGSDMTPLVVAGILLLIIASGVFYLWSRRDRVEDS